MQPPQNPMMQQQSAQGGGQQANPLMGNIEQLMKLRSLFQGGGAAASGGENPLMGVMSKGTMSDSAASNLMGGSGMGSGMGGGSSMFPEWAQGLGSSFMNYFGR